MTRFSLFEFWFGRFAWIIKKTKHRRHQEIETIWNANFKNREDHSVTKYVIWDVDGSQEFFFSWTVFRSDIVSLLTWLHALFERYFLFFFTNTTHATTVSIVVCINDFNKYWLVNAKFKYYLIRLLLPVEFHGIIHQYLYFVFVNYFE